MNNTLPIIITGIIGFIFGYITCSMLNQEIDATPLANNPATQVATTTADTNGSLSGNVINDSELVTGEPDDVAFSIAVASLPQTQQQALRLVGVDDDEIEITNSMVVCAESEFGSSRVIAIRDGASPSMSESVTLIGCYNENQ